MQNRKLWMSLCLDFGFLLTWFKFLLQCYRFDKDKSYLGMDTQAQQMECDRARRFQNHRKKLNTHVKAAGFPNNFCLPSHLARRSQGPLIHKGGRQAQRSQIHTHPTLQMCHNMNSIWFPRSLLLSLRSTGFHSVKHKSSASLHLFDIVMSRGPS